MCSLGCVWRALGSGPVGGSHADRTKALGRKMDDCAPEHALLLFSLKWGRDSTGGSRWASAESRPSRQQETCSSSVCCCCCVSSCAGRQAGGLTVHTPNGVYQHTLSVCVFPGAGHSGHTQAITGNLGHSGHSWDTSKLRPHSGHSGHS